MMFPWDPSEAEAADVESELPEYNLEPHFTGTIADAEIAVRICKKKKKKTPPPKTSFLFSPASYQCSHWWNLTENQVARESGRWSFAGFLASEVWTRVRRKPGGAGRQHARQHTSAVLSLCDNLVYLADFPPPQMRQWRGEWFKPREGGRP